MTTGTVPASSRDVLRSRGLLCQGSQVLFRRDEITPYAIMSPKSTMSNQLFAYAEILEYAVQDILRAHGTGDFT